MIGRDQSFAGKHCNSFCMIAGKAALDNLNAVLVIYFLLFLFSLVIKCNKKKVLYCYDSEKMWGKHMNVFSSMLNIFYSPFKI